MSMNTIEARFPLKEAVGTVISDAAQIEAAYAPFLHDESKLTGGPISEISFPRSAEEVSQVLQQNYSRGIFTCVSASRTALTGGASPTAGSHLLSVSKMQSIADICYHEDSAEYSIRLGAGVTLAGLTAHLAETNPRLFFPIDPTETSASVSGMCATNASGARSFYYGSIRPWVRWLRVVLADGAIVELTRGLNFAESGVIRLLYQDGSVRELKAGELSKPETKNTIGYCFHSEVDPIDIFIGSEGTLGVITDVEVALAPTPLVRLGFLQFFETEDAALNFVDLVRSDRETLRILAIEFCDRHSLELVQQSAVASSCRAASQIRADTEAAVYLEMVLSSEEALSEVFEVLLDRVIAVGAEIEHSVAGTEERDLRDLKVFRHAVPETINAIIAKRKLEIPSLHKLATDMAVPDAHLREVYSMYTESLRGHGLEFAIFGHIGNNHFHVNILPRTESELNLAKEQYLRFAERIVAMRGAVSAEHGIGRIKKDFLRIQYSDEVLGEMWKIKAFFDPKFLLNPGVLL